MPKESRWAVRERVLARLRAAPAPTTADLVDAVYSHREDGGPVWAASTIRVTIRNLRAEGHAIECERHGNTIPSRFSLAGKKS